MNLSFILILGFLAFQPFSFLGPISRVHIYIITLHNFVQCNGCQLKLLKHYNIWLADLNFLSHHSNVFFAIQIRNKHLLKWAFVFWFLSLAYIVNCESRQLVSVASFFSGQKFKLLYPYKKISLSYFWPKQKQKSKNMPQVSVTYLDS